MTAAWVEVERLPVGVPGLDLISNGGLSRDRLTLVSGTAGSGKTVFATQFLAVGIRDAAEPGVFVTFEERPDAIRRNVRSFGWDVATWEKDRHWRFVDASPSHDVETVFTGGSYDLQPLLARVLGAVDEIGAKRAALDSVGALIAQFDSSAPARHIVFRLADALRERGVTTVMTAERADDYGPIAAHGFEEFVADNVVILRNALEGEKRRRTVEVLKIRGGSHLKGEHLFTLLPGQGMVVVPVAVTAVPLHASSARATSGNDALDRMLGGGFFEKSLALVAGATGTGKSLLSAQFIHGGARQGERVLLHSFEEGREQLIRNAASWGMDFQQLEADGQLRIVAEAPEAAALEDHLQRMKTVIDEFRPARVAIDSLTALHRVATVKSFREYVLGLTYHIKERARLGLVTTTSQDFLTAEGAAGDLHVSTISDTIVLLHYVPVGGEVRRGINVLKMRGSDHDKSVREFSISGRGMEIGEPLADASGLF
jgi:circadian clock protein KaiC